jgi:hypothetical protein
MLAGGRDTLAELFFSSCPGIAESRGVAIESDAAADDFGTLLRIGDTPYFYSEGEAIKELRTELAFFRIHCADEDELCRMIDGDSFAFDIVMPHGSGIEEDIDEVVL